MILNLTRTTEREQFIHFIGPQNIGIEKGLAYGPEFEEKRKLDPEFAAKLEVILDRKLNAQKLKRGRISVFIDPLIDMYYQINDNQHYKNSRFIHL